MKMSRLKQGLAAALWEDSRLGLTIILVVALIARLGAVLWLGMTDLVEGSESGVIAANLSTGRGYTFDFYGYRPDAPLLSYMPPLYTLLLAVCLHLGPSAGILLGIIQAILGSFTAMFVYLAGKSLASPWIGWMAGVATALYPPVIIQTARPFSMTLHGFLLAGLIVLVLGFLHMPKLIRAGTVGLTIGLLTLSRTSMLGLAAIVVAWLWLNRFRIPQWYWLSIVIVAAAILIILPWAIRNYRIHGQLLLSTNGGHTFWNGNNPFTTGSALDVYIEKAIVYTGMNIAPPLAGDGIAELRPYPLPREVLSQVDRLSETELDTAFYAAGLAFIRENPRDWLNLLLAKLTSFWWFRPNLGRSSPIPGGESPYYDSRWIEPYRAIYVTVLVMFLIGLVWSFQNWRTFALIYMLFGYLTIVYAAFNVITRYRWEIEPFLLIFGMMGLVRLVPMSLQRLWKTMCADISGSLLG